MNTAQTPTGTLLKFQEAMTYLRVSRSTLYRLIESGDLKAHKVGGQWRFYLRDIRAAVKEEAHNEPL